MMAALARLKKRLGFSKDCLLTCSNVLVYMRKEYVTGDKVEDTFKVKTKPHSNTCACETRFLKNL